MRRAIAALGFASLGVAGLYRARRDIIGRALGLRPPEHGITVERDLPIRMPDGVKLYADHFRPRAAGVYPTILIRTPYGRPSETRILGPLSMPGPRLFAERGYNVIVQSTRGRYRSEGDFEPFLREQADGRATLDWIAAQPWFDGNLGLWGASYLGYTQWAVAADAPPFLKAIVPIITSSRFSRAFNPEGVFGYESSLRWTSYLRATHLPGRSLNLGAISQAISPRREAALRAAMAASPFALADRAALGETVPFFQRWLAEPEVDGAYWRSVDQHRGLGRVSAAVHLVAGWHDLFLPEQLADYTDLLAAGRSPYLTVLPRFHSEPALQAEGVREGLWWFDAHLKGRRELLERRAVRLALMGAHEWHEMDFWPPPARAVRFFLHTGGSLHTEPPGAPSAPGETTREEFSQYRYDPRDPTPSLGGPVLSPMGGARDQRPLEARPDLITFTTAPLPTAVDVIGHVRLELYVRSSLAHTDFVGRLCDVSPNGRSLNVSEGVARVTPGVGEPQPDGSLRLEINMWATAMRFGAGHRIRLHVCSGAHPRWSASSGDSRPLRAGALAGPAADQSIYHDTRHPSALVLPIVSTETWRAMAGEGQL
ncbi:MAG: CocE/NonD family hydrolase [Chloroflexales bacterium]|nr:CocE/NonD family hydrolase [Chloroflexales bacterium]